MVMKSLVQVKAEILWMAVGMGRVPMSPGLCQPSVMIKWREVCQEAWLSQGNSGQCVRNRTSVAKQDPQSSSWVSRAATRK